MYKNMIIIAWLVKEIYGALDKVALQFFMESFKNS